MSKSGKLVGLSVSAVIALAVFAAVLTLLFSSFGSGQEGPPPCPLPGGAGSFVLRGTVLNSSFHNATSLNASMWNVSANVSVNVSLYNMSFSGFGEPQRTFINQTITSPVNGSFSLKVGPGNCFALYTLSVIAYNASSWNAFEVGPSLPPVPAAALLNFLDNSTIYLQQAVTLNLNATNGTHNVSFSRIIFDDSLGFPISEDFMTIVFNASVVVPRAKNYTIMMMRPPQFSGPGDPFNLALPPQTVSVQNASNYSGSEFVVNLKKDLSFTLNTISGNITVDGSNSTAVNITQIVVKLGIAGLVPPNSDLQIPGGTVINQAPAGSGYIANYSATALGSASGIYQILEFYAANATATSSGIGEYFAYFSNFTVTGAISHNLTLKRLVGNYSSVTVGTTTINASFVRINISDANGLPLDDAHVEIKVDMVGHKTNFPTFRYMVDQLSGGVVSLPIINGSNATVLVFNRQYAPLKFRLNVTNASKELNGIIPVTLNAFKPRKFNANGSSEDFSGSKAGQFKLTFMKNSNACNVFNASLSNCRLFPNDFDAGDFNPLKVMASGKVNMLMEINTTGVKVYFIGVDMLASGPPEASMSDNALSTKTDGTSYQEFFKFGSAAPNIYDMVFVGIPYNYSRLNDSKPINFSINGLFLDSGQLAWNGSQTPNSSIPSDWSDYDTRWFNTTTGGMPCTNTEDLNSTNATCFINATTNYVWVKLPHFSDGEGGPSGGDAAPPAAPTPALVAVASTSGSSGGGGGGFALVSESSLLQKVLSSGDTGTFAFKKYADVAIYEIAAESAGAATNPSVTVRETNLATGVALPISKEAGKAYKYLSVTKANFEKVGKAMIKFSVPNSWFENNSADPATISLNKLVSKSWVKLPTKQIASSDTKFTSYETTTDGLSTFSITAENKKAPPKAAPLPLQPSAPKPIEAPTVAVVQQPPQPEVQPEQPAAPAEKEGGLGFASKTLITVILVIVGALVLLEVLHKLHKKKLHKKT